MSDYKFWAFLFQFVPHVLLEFIFTLYTAFQLYILGAEYLIREVHRKYSSSVRKLTDNEPDIPNDLSGQVVIVTGGSRGIGLCAAKFMYTRGATVIVTSSVSEEKERDRMAQSFRDSVKSVLVPGGSLVVWPVDLRDFSSVIDLVVRFNQTYKQLNVLVNNAGVMFCDKHYTVDGFEYHYQINYLSHVLLTWLLMPALQASSPNKARVVNVSSSTHFPRTVFIDDMQSVRTPYSPFHAYAQSKLCQIILTFYMADWLKSNDKYTNILVNTLHPGVAKTELYQHVWWVKMFPRLASLLFRVSSQDSIL